MSSRADDHRTVPSADKETRRMTSPRHILAIALLPALFALFAAATASAATAPHWTIITQPAPTTFHPGDEGDIYEIVAINDGDGDASAGATITDNLAEGLTVTDVIGKATFGFFGKHPLECESQVTGATSMVTCTDPAEGIAGEELNVKINVNVPADASGSVTNLATVSGGGVQDAIASTSTQITPSTQPVPYGGTAVTDVAGANGAEGTQAGSHPFDLTTSVAFNVGSVARGEECAETPSCAQPAGNAENVEVQLPPGVLGNPNAVPTCSQALFGQQTNYGCPADTQVGYIYLRFYGSGFANQEAPVYNIEPPLGQPAELGFSIAGVAHVPIFFHLRSDGDYGLTANVSRISEYSTPRFNALSIWGVPASALHDAQRRSEGACESGCPSDVPPKPFLTLPSACTGVPLSVPFFTNSWQEPSVFASSQPSLLPAINGCNQLEFEPTLQARPTTSLADSPSGLHVDLHLPQPESPEGLAEAHLKETKITLPKGLTVNPSSAAGLEGCSPAQIGLTSGLGVTPVRTSADPADCPAASKLGTVEVKTPLLKEPLPGAVYLAQPYANPFKSLLALYITVDDPKTNIVVKLGAEVEIAKDGQLSAIVKESPQVPFEDFKLDFFNGARAALRTPSVCGTYSTVSELTPYSAPESGPPAKPSDSYAINSAPGGGPCPKTEVTEPNRPSFEAGTASPLAGAFSPFGLHLHREDGSQVFSALNLNLPPGLTGKLAGTPYCPEPALAQAASKSGTEEQANPSCPAASRIGAANVGAGAGPAPYYVSAPAYLTGPYKGAPLSVTVITPAVAGPYDLGTVVLRNALYVNPETAQISVKSDPIPTALQGIQLDLRSIDLSVGRHEFTLNPTNCEKFSLSGEEISSLGQSAALSNPFQVGECGRLGFKPKLAIDLKGDTKRAGHPALRATLTYPKGGSYANIARAQVTLPKSEFLDNAHIGTVCTRVQFAANQCPPASVYGFARATSPLLEGPVEGPVYLRSSDHKLPDLVAALNGQIDVDLAGRIDTGKGGGIRNTFEVVPDAPVSKFVLSMKGAKKGLLVNSTNLCKTTSKALARFTAQNGKVAEAEPVITNSCKKARGKRGGR